MFLPKGNLHHHQIGHKSIVGNTFQLLYFVIATPECSHLQASYTYILITKDRHFFYHFQKIHILNSDFSVFISSQNMKSVKYDNIPLNTPLKAHAKSVGAVLYYKNTEQKVGNGWT